MDRNKSKDNRPVFQKRSGTSGNSGQLYEQKLVMYFLLSGLMAKKTGKIDKFYLGTNVETAGAFDDIVFKYVRRNISNVLLLQAKHKEKPNPINMAKLLSEKTKRGDFNIDHYFTSYQRSKHIFNQTDDRVLKDQFHNCEFILLTNASIDSKEYSFKYENDVDDFWKIISCKRTKFNLNDEFRDMFVNTTFSEPELKDFFRQFSIIFDQPNESQLDELLKKQIAEYLEIVQEDVKYIYGMTIAKIQNYWKNEINYLTENEDYFAESQKLWELQKEINIKIKFYSNLDITYHSVNKLCENIKKHTFLRIMSDKKTKLLYDRQIIQALNEMKLQYIFLSLSKFEEMNQIVFAALENEYDVLVISECDEINLNKYDLLIKDLLQLCPEKKIIILCKSIETTIQFEIITDLSIKFSDLNKESQKKMLNRQIEFQGKSVTLGEIVLPQLYNTIDEELLALLAEEARKLEIGQKMQDLGKLKSCHIFRKLTRNGIRYEPKDLLESKEDTSNKFILISGEPGMGKTTLLSSLSEDLNRNSSIIKWHYRINLAEHSTYFARIKQVSGLNFLRKACKMDEFENRLFTEYVEKEGRVVLFFDGFDEISPKYKEIVIKLLSDLIDTKVERMWITTRVCLKSELEKQFKTTAYQLEPFSKDDQKRYLQLYGGKDDQEIGKILRIFAESIHDQSTRFCAIPLQLQMFVDIYDESNEGSEINIFRMYKSFVRKKYLEIQMEEKSGVDVSNLALQPMIETNYEDAIVKYEKLAILTLYEDYMYHLFNNSEIEEIKKALIDGVDGGNEKTGIVVSVVDQKPIFVHRTFAEFFAATCLVRALEDNKKIDDFLFAIGYFDIGQKVMRTFLDFALGDEEEIFTATLNNDYYKIKELADDYGKRDKGGRTPLHLAAAKGFAEITYLLIRNVEISLVDRIFGWTPISYADKMQNIIIVDLLLGNNAKSQDMFDIIKTVKNYPHGDLILLQKIFSFDSTIFLKEIIKINSDFVNFENRNDFHKTPLHYATSMNNLDAIKLMININGCQLKHDLNGSTIFHECASKGYLKCMEYLTENWTKFQINFVDRFGRTPLFVAAEKGHVDVVNLLIERGSTMDDNNWKKILQITEELGHSSIADLLKNNKAKITKQPVNATSLDVGIGITITDGDLAKLNEMGKAIQINNLKRVKKIFFQDIHLIDRIISQPDKCEKKEILFKILSIAISFKEIKIVEFLVSQNKQLLYLTNYIGSTLLHCACLLGNLSIIIFLLSKGADLKTKDLSRRTCVFYAAERGHFKVLKHFVLLNADIINDVDFYENTLLHAAAQFGHKDFAVQLIDEGVKLDKRNVDGANFLHCAAQHNHTEFVKHFISLNKELIYTKDYGGNNLLHTAAENGATETVAYLFELDSGLMALNNEGMTPVHSSICGDHLDVIKYFLNKNIDLINAHTQNGLTILHLAANKCTIETVNYLLEKGADPSMKDDIECTCLHWAVFNHEIDIMKLFLKIIPELVNSGDADGNTPLHIAAQQNTIEVAELLLQHKASLLIANINGITCLHVAVAEGHLQFVQKFVPLFKQMTRDDPKQFHNLLKVAAKHNKFEIFNYLIEQGADPWAKFENELSILLTAIREGHLCIVQYLVTMDKTCVDNNYITTPLCMAAALNRIEILTFLLEQGADPTIKDINGYSCLDVATPEGELEIIKYLPSK